MNRCFVFGALPVGKLPVVPEKDDYVIAADKGIERTAALGITPDLLVGDFDSLGYEPEFRNKISLNVRKDDTDTDHALAVAYEKGYRDFVVYGAVGGKLDHTVANIQLAQSLAERDCRVRFIGDDQSFTVLRNGSVSFPPEYSGRISVFSLLPESRGVCIRGLSYVLENGTLYGNVPLGVSNAFIGEESQVSVSDGILLVIYDTN